MTRSAYACSFACTAVRLVVLIAVLSMPPRPAEAGSGCRAEGDPCATNQSCCTGLCFKTTGLFGTCRLPTARWHNGDVFTFNQGDWGASCTPLTTVGILLQDNYSTIYAATFGILEVGIVGPAGFSIAFTSATRVIDYLPQSGTPGPLTADLLDPSTSPSGAFGGEVVALKLNIDFIDAGLILGGSELEFGDLTLCNFPRCRASTAWPSVSSWPSSTHCSAAVPPASPSLISLQ